MRYTKTTYHTQNIKGIPVGVPNEITNRNKQYYISYNNYDTAIYGSDTTALCTNESFFILNGNHTKEYKKLNSLEECLKYFYDNIEEINFMSDK